jgi:hypothetical protein
VIRVGSFLACAGAFGPAARARAKNKLTYVRRTRSRRVQKWVAGLADSQLPPPPSELPQATLRTRGAASVVGDTGAWLRERGAWIKPRAVPLVFAFAALIGSLASVEYLSNLASPRVAEVPQLMPTLRVESGPPGDDAVRDDVRPTIVYAIRIGD